MAVAVCTNASETDTVPLWFTGKNAHPRCLNNINIQHLGCQYYANKKAWMAGELFQEWLRWFGKYIGTEWEVVSILDNFSGHELGSDICDIPANIRIEYLPPNTKSKLQPCDQGFIQTLKAHTKRAILRNLLDFIEKYPTLESRQYHTKKGDLKTHKFAPDVHNAMIFMTSAWQTATTATIQNCFRKAGIHYEDPGLLAFSDPLMEVTEILDVVKVDMARI